MMILRRVAVVAGLIASAACAYAGSTEAASSGATELGTAEGDGYSIRASDVSTSAGKEGSIVITIQAKSGYKVNKEYPHKVKTEEPPSGVELPKREAKKDDGSFKGDQTFEFTLPVKALQAGTYEVGLEVKTSVCNDS